MKKFALALIPFLSLNALADFDLDDNDLPGGSTALIDKPPLQPGDGNIIENPPEETSLSQEFQDLHLENAEVTATPDTQTETQ